MYKKIEIKFVTIRLENDCMLCGKPAEVDAHHPERKQVHVEVIPTKNTLAVKKVVAKT